MSFGARGRRGCLNSKGTTCADDGKLGQTVRADANQLHKKGAFPGESKILRDCKLMPTSILLGVDTGHKQFSEALFRDNPAPAKTSGFVYIRSSQSLSSSSTSNASLTTNLISSDDIAVCLTELSILLHRKEISLASNSNSIKLYIRSLLERYQVRRMKLTRQRRTHQV